MSAAFLVNVEGVLQARDDLLEAKGKRSFSLRFRSPGKRKGFPQEESPASHQKDAVKQIIRS
ncbi:hypothetical protein C4H11_04810 [Bacteroides zoogleoformans]|uniref:Uncharacterized protein n=1 Tax=Bacteroides zoogleoformans TaxID=28119 RepID=A0ABN5IJG9_9BACE|nr:hypothetical protein C4H11_04810 [Bacteroides zoogleoformans]